MLLSSRLFVKRTETRLSTTSTYTTRRKSIGKGSDMFKRDAVERSTVKDNLIGTKASVILSISPRGARGILLRQFHVRAQAQPKVFKRQTTIFIRRDTAMITHEYNRIKEVGEGFHHKVLVTEKQGTIERRITDRRVTVASRAYFRVINTTNLDGGMLRIDQRRATTIDIRTVTETETSSAKGTIHVLNPASARTATSLSKACTSRLENIKALKKLGTVDMLDMANSTGGENDAISNRNDSVNVTIHWHCRKGGHEWRVIHRQKYQM